MWADFLSHFQDEVGNDAQQFDGDLGQDENVEVENP